MEIQLLTRPMSKSFFLFFLLTIFVSLRASANTITVKKIKGHQAVIEMSVPLDEGKTYNLETENITLQTNYSSQFKSRFNTIGLGANLNFLSGNKVLDNTISVFGKYGWNHSVFEFGPILNLEMSDQGFGSNTQYLIGGYFDYNYSENKNSQEFVYGPSFQFSLGNKNFAGGGSAQITQAQFSAFLTWFINNSSVALRTELGYLYRKVNSSTDETTMTGFTSQIYFQYYY